MLIVVCGTSSGCGIRGPLVLPEPARTALAASIADKHAPIPTLLITGKT